MTYIIAIDGPAGSGKSSVAAMLAKKLGFERINTGAIYRAFALHYGKSNINPSEINEAIKSFDFKVVKDRMYLKGTDVTELIQSHATGLIASAISQVPEVRKFLLPFQRALAEQKSCVVEGRDIGSVVFPNADLKIFLTASIDERARRRKQEFPDLDLENLKKEISQRDHQDTTRSLAPLKKMPDAFEIISDGMNQEEVVELILKKFYEKKGHSR